MKPWWHQVWEGLVDEFSDVPDLDRATRIIARLTLAGLLGGLIGFNRERAGKPAGVRTHMLVALGAAFFVLVPQLDGMRLGPLSRIIQGVITGIGFLCTGVILKRGDEGIIQGLTTAAGLWLTAALGVAAGLGREFSALLGGVLCFLILGAVTQFKRWWSRGREPPRHPSGSCISISRGEDARDQRDGLGEADK